MYNFENLVNIISELRSDHGCPWDREQTLESLKPCLTEETGEILQALANHDMENLCEELGDVLYLILLYSQIAAESQAFTSEEVVNGICEKMIRRHPHVFGNIKVNSKEEESALWEEIKRLEKTNKA